MNSSFCNISKPIKLLGDKYENVCGVFAVSLALVAIFSRFKSCGC